MENPENLAHSERDNTRLAKTKNKSWLSSFGWISFVGKTIGGSIHLFLIPVLTLWVTQYLASETNGQKLLSDYYDKTETFLLKTANKNQNHLQTTAQKQMQEHYKIANARTLSTLRELDGTRKGMLLFFLSEVNLIQEIGLKRADLKRAYLEGLNLKETLLQGSDFRGANLRKTNFTRAKLGWSDFSGGGSGWFHQKNLSCKATGYFPGAPRWFANGCVADLGEANLQGADLQGANLREANLREANLQGADLQGGYYNKNTKFPHGFNPAEAGMVLK